MSPRLSGRARSTTPTAPDVDQRVWGRRYHGPRPWVFGVVMVVLLAFAAVLAYTKELPFSGPGYVLHATFENAANLRPDSPVRIAGVNVGKVQSIEAKGDAAEVTFTVDDEGRPVHEDATVEIRPRLFLEGNFFLDLSPGTPEAPELDDGGDIPITNTSTAVQLDQILTSLDSGSRQDLQQLLEGFGTALTHEPTAAEDASQDPDVQGETAAEALNQAFHYGATGNRDTAIANNALLGTEPHDLSGLIRASSRVFGTLISREGDLKGLISNFNTTTGALASESANLSESVRLLAPTLEQGDPALRHLSEALPSLRRFARALRPGVEELPATIRAGEPWLRQTQKLLRDGALGGLAVQLRRGAPGLAKTAAGSRRLFPQLRSFSRCTYQVLDPTGDIVIDDAGGDYDFSTGQPNFNEFLYSLVNLGGESQSFDGNGPYVRFQSGGGPVQVQATNRNPLLPQDTPLFGHAIAAPEGTRPTFPDRVPPFRTDVRCASNALPDLNGGPGLPGGVGPPSPEATGP